MLVEWWNVGSQDYLTHKDWTGLAAPDFTFVLAQIALGLWLLFGARGLISLLASARNLGRDPEPSQEAASDSVELRPEN